MLKDTLEKIWEQLKGIGTLAYMLLAGFLILVAFVLVSLFKIVILPVWFILAIYYSWTDYQCYDWESRLDRMMEKLTAYIEWGIE